MKLHFTKHAMQRLAKRGLKPEWIEKIVAAPQLVEPDLEDADLEHRLGVLPELDNRVLRVIVSISEPTRVITAFPDHSMKGKL
jgi:uncharacterized DUF497 family protein